MGGLKYMHVITCNYREMRIPPKLNAGGRTNDLADGRRCFFALIGPFHFVLWHWLYMRPVDQYIAVASPSWRTSLITQ